MSLTPLQQECIQLARRFRLGHSVESLQRLAPLLEQVMAALPPAQLTAASHCIAAMLACQERQDWLGLADWLEYEFTALLAI